LSSNLIIIIYKLQSWVINYKLQSWVISYKLQSWVISYKLQSWVTSCLQITIMNYKQITRYNHERVINYKIQSWVIMQGATMSYNLQDRYHYEL
jgi:hypothetical protein